MINFSIYGTGRVALFAIPSAEHAHTIFTIRGDCATEVYIKNKVHNNNINNNNNNNNIVRYSAAGYIEIQMVEYPHTGTHGYGLSQNEDTWELTVHLTTNNVVTVPGPIYDRRTNEFFCSISIFR